MSVRRQYAVSAPLRDGRVLIAAGRGASASPSSAEGFESVPEAAAAGGDFGDVTTGQPSGVQTVAGRQGRA